MRSSLVPGCRMTSRVPGRTTLSSLASMPPGGVAGDAAISHHGIDALRLQQGLQPGGVGLVEGHAPAVRVAGAERDDGHGVRLRAGLRQREHGRENGGGKTQHD